MTASSGLSFIASFFLQFRNYPDSPAFGISGKTYSYKELMERVQSIWHQLDTSLDSSEKRVAVFATQEIETYASILAVLASGRAYVPLNPHNPPERNWSCLEQADCQTMLRGEKRTTLETRIGDRRLELKIIETAKAGSPPLSVPHLRKTQTTWPIFYLPPAAREPRREFPFTTGISKLL